MKKEHKIILIVGIFYLIYILLFLAKFDFNPSATIELSEGSNKYNAPLPPNLVVQVNSSGYDGQYYYMIATDLAHKRILVDSYRYQRILYPFFAYLFSFGIISLIPLSLLLINFISVVLGTYILLLILKKYNANLNLAYLWAFNVGFFISIIRDLTSPLMFLFVLLSLYYFEKKNFKTSSLFLATAVLTRETALLIVVPLLTYFFIKQKFKNFVIYSVPIGIFLIWQLIISLNLGEFAILQSSSSIGLPFLGIIKYFFWIDFPKSLSELYIYFSVLPVIIFLFVQGYVLLRSRWRFTPYLTILLFQMLFIIMLKFWLYTEQIDALGRFGMSLFLFSILYSAERKQRYNLLLILLTILMSIGYFVVKIIMFKVGYFVT